MPTELPEAQVTTFGVRRFRLVAYLLFAIVSALLGLMFGGWLVAFNTYGLSPMTVIGVIAGVSLTVYGGWLAWYSYRRLVHGDPAITVGPEGLTDRILHEGPIPWAEMQKPLLRPSSRSSWQLMFDLTPESEARIGIAEWRRKYAAFARSFGYRSYRVIFLGTTATQKKMAAALDPLVAYTRSTKVSRLLMGE